MCCFNHVHFVHTIVSVLFFKASTTVVKIKVLHIIIRVEKETYCSSRDLEVETGMRFARSRKTKKVYGGKERGVE